MAIAAGVLTVSATSTRITAATVAPTCGIRSRKPVMTASTIGNGRPKIHAETPATVAATSEIARLPISDEETALIDSSRTGCQRFWTAGGARSNSHSVIVVALDQHEQRQERQRDQREDAAEDPAGDPEQRARRVGQALGEVLQRRLHLSSCEPLEMNVWNASLELICCQ